MQRRLHALEQVLWDNMRGPAQRRGGSAQDLRDASRLHGTLSACRELSITEGIVHITLGSNIYHDTNGVINTEGREQIRLELDGSDVVILTLTCFDAAGQRTAHLLRNEWAENHGSDLTVISVLGGVRIERTAGGEVVLDVRATDSDSVEIVEGSLRTHTGRMLQITPDHWQIGDKTMGGFVFNCQGAAVSIA